MMDVSSTQLMLVLVVVPPPRAERNEPRSDLYQHKKSDNFSTDAEHWAALKMVQTGLGLAKNLRLSSRTR